MTVDIKEAVIDGVVLRFLKYHIVPRFLTCSPTTRSRFIPLHEQPILPHADSGGFLSNYCECEQERRSLSPQTIETRSTEKLSGLFDCPIPQQEHKPLTTEATMDGDRIDVAAAKEGTATHILLSLLSPKFLHGGRFVDGELVDDDNIPLQERDLKLWKLTADKGDAVTLRKMAGYFGISREQDVFSISAALLEWIPPSTVPPPSSSADEKVEMLVGLMEKQLALEEQRKRDEEQRKREEEQRREELRLLFEEQRREELRLLFEEQRKREEEQKRKAEEEQRKRDEEQRKRDEEQRREEEKQRTMEKQLALEEQRKREEEQRKREEEQRREELRMFFEEQRKREEDQRRKEEKSFEWLARMLSSKQSSDVFTISAADVFRQYVKELCLPSSFVPGVKASPRLREFFVDHIIVDANKSESRGLQAAWSNFGLKNFNPEKPEDCVDELRDSRRVLKDTHSTKILVQGRQISPDLILRFGGYPDECALVIFELKSDGVAWQENQQGQIVDYLIRLMKEQKEYRSFVFGVYMTYRQVQFFKCSAGMPLAITASVPISLSDPNETFDGIDYIAGLLRAKDSELGWQLSNCLKQVSSEGFPAVTVLAEHLLGSGAYADVFAGCLIGDGGNESSGRVVLKEFKEHGRSHSFLREKAFLSKFRDDSELRGKIPRLISASSDGPDDQCPRLVVEPIGTHVTNAEKRKSTSSTLPQHTPVTAEIFCQLVDILKIVHAKGYVHGDIKLNNFFVHSDGSERAGHVFLNDWGSVVSVNDDVLCPAFLPHAPEVVLDCLGENVPYSAKPEYDLYAVVCTLYAGFFPRQVNPMYEQYKKSNIVEAVKMFWVRRKNDSKLLNKMFDQALSLEYDELKSAIREFLL